MLYQYGTMAGLMAGAFSGTTTVKNLLKHGDFGIGTFEGVDGEMLIYNGVVYKTDSDGISSIQDDSTLAPFANVTKFSTDKNIITDATFENLFKKIDLNPNYFYAIKITGNFEKINTRSPKKHEKPYPPLLDILKTQSIFNYENASGIIVGFFSPEYVQGVGIGGLHLHFLSDDKTKGGHVFDFEISNANIEISKPLNFTLELPQSEEYQAIDIDFASLQNEITKAESGEDI